MAAKTKEQEPAPIEEQPDETPDQEPTGFGAWPEGQEGT